MVNWHSYGKDLPPCSLALRLFALWIRSFRLSVYSCVASVLLLAIQLSCFRYRVTVLTRRLASKYQTKIADYKAAGFSKVTLLSSHVALEHCFLSQMRAWNDLVPLAQELGLAYVELLIAQKFAAAIRDQQREVSWLLDWFWCIYSSMNSSS